MNTEVREKARADAQRLLDCDGRHLRQWARVRPDEFVRVVHGVAVLALEEPSAPPIPASRSQEDWSRGGYQPRTDTASSRPPANPPNEGTSGRQSK